MNTNSQRLLAATTLKLGGFATFNAEAAMLRLSLRPGLPNLAGWLAVRGGHLAGAAALLADGGTAAAWVAVPEPFRRQGIGRALLATLETEARAQGAGRLAAFEPVKDEPGRAFCAALGWRLTQTFESFETGLDDAELFLERYERRFRARGSLPPDLCVCHGEDMPWGFCRDLLEPEFGLGIAQRLGRRVTHGPLPLEWEAALLLGERPVAATLGHAEGEAAVVDAYAVAPDFRGNGWANVMARLLTIRHVRDRFPEARLYRFGAGDAHGDTRKSARMGEAQGFASRHTGSVWHFEKQ